jgi:L-aminopeptidase/D-esterase-like protein
MSPPQQFAGTVAQLCDPKRVAVAADQEHRGSIIIVIATDAHLTPDQLKRLARRASVGLGRLGAIESDGSGDILMTGADYWTIAALPHDELQKVLLGHGLLQPGARLH